MTDHPDVSSEPWQPAGALGRGDGAGTVFPRVSDKVSLVFNVPKHPEMFLLCHSTARKVSVTPNKKIENLDLDDRDSRSSEKKIENRDKR